MISVEELAALVGQRVKLQKKGSSWWGLCPFPDHREKTPSFHVYRGRDGRGRYHCHGCARDGDGLDWQRKVLGERGDGDYKPDPAIELEHEQRRFAEGEWQALRDRYPELPEEARAFIEPDLRGSLRRHLGCATQDL